MVHPGATITGQRLGDHGVAILRGVQRQPDAAAGATHGAALHQPIGIGQQQLVVGLEIEQAAIEQHPAGQAFGRQRGSHVIDTPQARILRADRMQAKVDVVVALPWRAGLEQIDQAAVRRAHGRNLPLVRPDQATVGLAAKGAGTRQRRPLFVDLQRHCTHRRAMRLEVVVGKRIGLGVEHDIDLALAKQLHILRAVLTDMGEAKTLQPAAEAHGVRLVHRELEEIDAFVARCRRWREQRLRQRRAGRGTQALPGFLFQVLKRTQAVSGDASRRRSAEAIVENFQRQRAAVAGLQHRCEKARQVEFALTGKTTEMPTPLQHIHCQQRRIGELYEEDPLARDIDDAARVIAQRQRMETVENHPQCRIVDLLYQ